MIGSLLCCSLHKSPPAHVMHSDLHRPAAKFTAPGRSKSWREAPAQGAAQRTPHCGATAWLSFDRIRLKIMRPRSYPQYCRNARKHGLSIAFVGTVALP
jgi:hypothetical protein